MTLSPWLIYFITVLDSICIASGAAIGILSIIILIWHWVRIMDIAIEERSIISKPPKYLYILATLAIFCAVFIPSTKQMCAILVIPAIINSETTQEIAVEFKQLAFEWFNELKPNIKDASN